MNETITSREELLLAKIAGRDVDLRTMTPPVASNLTEKFMLEIADRLDGMGGDSGENFETVAEIEVETMVEYEGMYVYQVPSESRPTFRWKDLENLYVDGYKLEKIDAETFAYNIDPQTMQPIATPCYGLIFDGGDEIGYDLIAIATDPDLSNTTVKILKKVSAPSGDGDALIVTATFGQNFAVENISASFAEVKAAAVANKPVIIIVQTPSELDKVVVSGVLEYLNNDSGTAYFSGIGQSPLSGDDNRFVLKMTEVDGVTSVMLNMFPVKPTYEFAFSAAISNNQITYTPTEGVTYAAIAAALAETPHVKAIITLPEAIGATITADFNFSISGDEGVGYAANAVCIIGSDPVAFVLNVGENEGQTVCTGLMKTLAVASA